MQDRIIKAKSESDSTYGTNPNERTVEELIEKGYLVLDKESGPTSHEVTDNVKKILKSSKTGHSGTLDPKVTGVLLIGLGRATRLMEYMLKSNKEYVCLMYIHKEVEREKIEEALKKFTGIIKQTPPLVSAVKREEREREIYSIKLLDMDKKDVLFRVSCQHGTYIRKLCSDLGDYLKTGAHMKELRRTKAGPFTEDDNLISSDKLRNLFELYNETEDKKEKKIYELELKKYLRPMEETVKEFKSIYIRDTAVKSLSHGHDLAIPGILELDKDINEKEEIAIKTFKGELIAMGEAVLNSKQIEKEKKGLAVKINKVFIETI